MRPRVVIEFDLPATHSPDNLPTVFVREAAEGVVADRLEKFQLSWMRNKVFGSARKLLCDDANHGLKWGAMFLVHGMTQSPLIGRLGGRRRGGGRSFGVGGGLGGRFNFWPSALRAFSDGLGPRASGFFMTK